MNFNWMLNTMLNSYYINKLQTLIDEAKLNNDFAALENFVKKEKTVTDEQFICSITWTLDDVKKLRPEWSDEQVSQAVFSISKHLENRSIEEGWEILETLITGNKNDITLNNDKVAVFLQEDRFGRDIYMLPNGSEVCCDNSNNPYFYTLSAEKEPECPAKPEYQPKGGPKKAFDIPGHLTEHEHSQE